MSADQGQPVANLAVSVTVISDTYATAAAAEFDGVHATGSAKKEHGEVYNTDIAVDLAVSRALVKLSRLLQRRGNRRVTEALQEQARERVLAQIRKLQRTAAVRDRELLSLEYIQQNHGSAAAERAADRRAARGNGLPTVDSGDGS